MRIPRCLIVKRVTFDEQPGPLIVKQQHDMYFWVSGSIPDGDMVDAVVVREDDPKYQTLGMREYGKQVRTLLRRESRQSLASKLKQTEEWVQFFEEYK